MWLMMLLHQRVRITTAPIADAVRIIPRTVAKPICIS